MRHSVAVSPDHREGHECSSERYRAEHEREEGRDPDLQLPGLQRSVKWGMSYYGVGDGWCFSCGGFAGHVKLMFLNGAALKPVPPVTPLAMGKSTRGVELKAVGDLDEGQVAAWMKQIAAVPGVGKKQR